MVLLIHASQYRSQAKIFFAVHNGFPIVRFIRTIVIQPAPMRSIKTPSSPIGLEDAIVHPVIF